MENKAVFHCPRWHELPDLGLYLDQVLLVIEETLAPVLAAEGKIITSTMVNNYVKHKLMLPSNKKKYGREHLADLIMITLFKHVLSAAETKVVMSQLKEQLPEDAAYNLFCCELEHQLGQVWGMTPTEDESGCPQLAASAIRALAGKLAFEMQLKEFCERSKKEELE